MDVKEELVKLCHKIGNRIPTWTQGQGGNASLKENGKLWIKASGERLDSVAASRGLAVLDINGFLAEIQPSPSISDENQYSKAIAETKDPSYGTPSMETGFHAVLPRRVVLHFHSLAAILMGHVMEHQETKWKSWISTHTKKSQICPVPLICPGRKLMAAIGDLPRAEIYILKNHGVILHSDSEGILDQWQALEIQFCEAFGYKTLKALLESTHPWSDATAQVKEIHSKELKLYFPDAAVFKPQLNLHLAKNRSIGDPAILAERAERNLDEILCATVLLNLLEPKLQEISPELALEIRGMPLEKERIQKISRNSESGNK